MKIAIHNSDYGFHPRWISYCEKHEIPYKLVNCYDSDIIDQIRGCDALFWHHRQSHSRDLIISKQLLFALEHAGIIVFPDFKTQWHFDDKVGQKYLLEALELPLVKSYVFLDKKEALDWVERTSFPKVFKLRGGAGSANVKLIKNKKEAGRIVRKAFGAGFKQYDAWYNLKERIYKWKRGKGNFKNVLKGIVRLGYEPRYSKIIGRERDYTYFQDFVPDNDSDIRIIIVSGRAFGIKRMVRKGDFRASGSGEFYYDRNLFPEECIALAFKANERIKSQSLAVDFVFDNENNPKIVEISYGFIADVYDPCPGYWDKDLTWHEETFNPYGWMIESVIDRIKNKNYF